MGLAHLFLALTFIVSSSSTCLFEIFSGKITFFSSQEWCIYLLLLYTVPAWVGSHAWAPSKLMRHPCCLQLLLPIADPVSFSWDKNKNIINALVSYPSVQCWHHFLYSAGILVFIIPLNKMSRGDIQCFITAILQLYSISNSSGYKVFFHWSEATVNFLVLSEDLF